MGGESSGTDIEGAAILPEEPEELAGQEDLTSEEAIKRLLGSNASPPSMLPSELSSPVVPIG